MSHNNYLPFSTAPKAHGPVMHSAHQPHQVHVVPHHSNPTTNNGHHDGRLAPSFGTMPSGVVVGASAVGVGMHSSYPIPPPQLQPHATGSLQNLNTPAVSLGSLMSGGGPAVPAPRSAATLLAEATGAPPPPPAPTRTIVGGGGNSMAAAGTIASNATTGSVPVAGVTSNFCSAVGSALLPSSTVTDSTATSLVSPSFRAFTTSAAAMLSSMMASDTATSCELSGNGALVNGPASIGSTAAATMPPNAAAANATLSRPLLMNPYENVEIRFTMRDPSEPDVVSKEVSAFGLAKEAPVDPTIDFFTRMLAENILSGEDGGDRSDARNSEADANQWYLFIADRKTPQKAAVALSAEMTRRHGEELRTMLEGLASTIMYYNVWAVIDALGIRERLTLRHMAVRTVLENILFYRRRVDEAEKYVSKLACMLHMKWVSEKGVASVIDMCLQREDLVDVGLRILAKSMESNTYIKTFRAALAAVPRVARRLAEILETQPARELDVALSTRWWRGMPPSMYGSVPVTNPQAKVADVPVTCMSYFGVRDELVSGDMSGVVTLWGPPQTGCDASGKHSVPPMTLFVRPRAVVPLPMNCVPVAMAGQLIEGQYLAIAGMPFKSLMPYSQYCGPDAARSTPVPGRNRVSAEAALENADADVVRKDTAQSPVAGSPFQAGGAGAIIVITCNENSISWSKGEIIPRPPGTVVTAITAFRNSIVAVGESALNATAVDPTTGGSGAVRGRDGNVPHRLSFVDVMNGTVIRQISGAHDDFITSLTVLEESGYVLLSGGRDSALKVWDPRSSEDAPVVNTAYCTGARHHEGTISSIATTGYHIISTDVDGMMAVWDLRAMGAPQLCHNFAYPIASSALLCRNRVAAATTRGIVLAALDTLEPLDLCYEKGCCTHVLTNESGNVLFTTHRGMIEVIGVGDT